MMNDENRLDQELDRTAGSPALAKALKKQILALRDGVAGPQLAEMARDLLDGRIELRTIASSDAYAQPLTEATSRYQAWYENLDEDQRTNLAAEAQRLIGDETDDGRRRS
jgi:hypothetical protein